MHFMESASETEFLASHSGPLAEAYKKFLPPVAGFETPKDHVSTVLNELTGSGNLILVHNTFIKKDDIEKLSQRKNTWYCLCPNSNIYIEGKVPPADLLNNEGCDVVIGTDSLSSNKKLSMLDEIRTLQNSFPGIGLETLIGWATLNGAKALKEDGWSGSIEPGKKPGLVLLKNTDLINLRLLPETTAQRLI
jgi:cytosine/adenosine deaminase-related metal-dependent hydrolase